MFQTFIKNIFHCVKNSGWKLQLWQEVFRQTREPLLIFMGNSISIGLAHNYVLGNCTSTTCVGLHIKVSFLKVHMKFFAMIMFDRLSFPSCFFMVLFTKRDRVREKTKTKQNKATQKNPQTNKKNNQTKKNHLSKKKPTKKPPQTKSKQPKKPKIQTLKSKTKKNPTQTQTKQNIYQPYITVYSYCQA